MFMISSTTEVKSKDLHRVESHSTHCLLLGRWGWQHSVDIGLCTAASGLEGTSAAMAAPEPAGQRDSAPGSAAFPAPHTGSGSTAHQQPPSASSQTPGTRLAPGFCGAALRVCSVPFALPSCISYQTRLLWPGKTGDFKLLTKRQRSRTPALQLWHNQNFACSCPSRSSKHQAHLPPAELMPTQANARSCFLHPRWRSHAHHMCTS